MNEVRLQGYLTKDVSLATVGKNDTIKASVCIGINNGTKSNFPYCVAWGDIGKEFATLKKGENVKILGRLETNSYSTEDGTKKYSTYVLVLNFVKCENVAKLAEMPF